MVQLSHPYMTTGKIIALTRRTFVGKVMSLLFNMLSWLVIAFLPGRKCFLISCLQSSSAVILEPPKIKSLFPLFSHLFAMKWWDRMPWSLFFECWVLSHLFHLTVKDDKHPSRQPNIHENWQKQWLRDTESQRLEVLELADIKIVRKWILMCNI